ncbi:hypothetical protein C0Q70_13844 [Pomacea canaliculata]|uniref:Nuclear nucleic acid-binding protein C1D n=1 Tax=Pomacea canaliculata TaxID=400727 RepID=A0A2T7NYC2_POMCA|nr:nuclear nucleic acid-binding protein C1D-like [Pomacea canaliculata]PVD26175.1 hypothetical protein C0Q70_13844 [Pomacea canaliculata]
MEKTSVADMPAEIKERLASFDESLSNLDALLQPLLATPHSELVEKLQPLDSAKMDLVVAYSINSLFWMYLNLCGVNPKDHPVKQELERIRSYMNRVKEAQESLNAPKIDKAAAKRFIKSALWQKAKQQQENSSQSEVQPSSSSESTDISNSGGRKRKHKD